MRILLFSNLYYPEPTGVSLYSHDLACELIKRGHEVTVIAANPSYPNWKLFPGYSPWKWRRSNVGGVNINHCPVYVPAKISGAKRILHYASFAVTSLIPALRGVWRTKPDMVMLVAPTLLAGGTALLAAKLSRALSWVHVQDFEVEAGFALGQIKGGAFARMALWLERVLIGAFDQASSISPAMCQKLVAKGRPEASVHEVRNWSDIDTIKPMEALSPYRDKWGIKTPYVALYSGNIAAKQGMELVIDAARKLKGRSDLTFVICGEGANREALEETAQGLDNIQFHNLQPLEMLNDLMALATVHLLPQRADAADLVLPSKLTNMLASGRPVVATAARGTGLAEEVEGCGIVTEPGVSEAFTQAISALLDEPERMQKLGHMARHRAEERWSRAAIIDRFNALIVRLTNEGKGIG